MIAWLERAKQGPPLRFGTGIGRWDECTEVHVCKRFWGEGGLYGLTHRSIIVVVEEEEEKAHDVVLLFGREAVELVDIT
jgi:hypothetical protein